MTYSVFVVKCRGKFCRFGSYRTVSLVDNPLKAKLYARKRDAEKRMQQDHYRGQEKILSTEFSLTTISMAPDMSGEKGGNA